MKRTRFARLKVLCCTFFTLYSLLLSPAMAQGVQETYRTAYDALQKSIETLESDQVASLDALRAAQTAFASVTENLDDKVQQTITNTFNQAETAIVNQSANDLQIQTSVLRGTLQRSLYEVAIRDAQGGDLPAATSLLDTLAKDLGFANPEITGQNAGELQRAFENQLAQLNGEQIGNLGEGKAVQIANLASVYGNTLLVQDSPRLPENTSSEIVQAIRSLAAGEPVDDALTGLQQNFAALAQATEPAQAASPAASEDAANQEQPVQEQPAQEQSSQEQPSTAAQADGATDAATTEDATTEDATADGATARRPLAQTQGPATAEPAAEDGAAQATPQADAAQPDTTGPAATPATTAPLFADFQPDALDALPKENILFMTIYPLFAACGILALIVLFATLLRRNTGRNKLLESALALLLLPSIYEGVLASAKLLANALNMPALEGLSQYSMFHNPWVTLAWMLITALAIIFIVLGWRTQTQTVVTSPATVREQETFHAEAPTEEAIVARAAESSFNWDEEF